MQEGIEDQQGIVVSWGSWGQIASPVSKLILTTRHPSELEKLSDLPGREHKGCDWINW